MAIFLGVISQGLSSHIVGGEIFFNYQRGNSYQLGLIMYYDQANAEFNLIDEEIILGVYKKNDNTLVKAINVPLNDVRPVQYSNTQCIADSIKTLEIIYQTNENFLIQDFSTPDGYYISWERCCRNNIVTNIFSPGTTGMVFYLEFPSLRDFPFYSSPRFDRVLGDYVCRGQEFSIPTIASPVIGDSISYDLVLPLAGFTSNLYPISNLDPGPYPTVQGYSNMPGTPPMRIDPVTGILSGTPTLTGLYAFTVRAKEYLAGVQISEIRRDFQLPVTNCLIDSSPNFKLFLGPNEKFEGDTLIADGNGELCFQIEAWDQSTWDQLSFSLNPLNFNDLGSDVFDPSGGNTQGQDDTLFVDFCWPRCFQQEADKLFEFDIVLSDNACPTPNQSIKRYYLKAIPENNSQPAIEVEFPTYRAEVGEETQIRVSATDDDLLDDLVLQFDPALNEGFGIQSEFQVLSGQGWADGVLSIFPDCQDLLEDEFTLFFTVNDNSCRENNADTTSTLLQIEDYFAGEGDFRPPPNVITPNNDGLNDEFTLPMPFRGRCEMGIFKEVSIYNRWGNEVFRSSGIDFSWKAEDLPAGDYYYLIEFDGFSFNGYVKLIK